MLRTPPDACTGVRDRGAISRINDRSGPSRRPSFSTAVTRNAASGSQSRPSMNSTASTELVGRVVDRFHHRSVRSPLCRRVEVDDMDAAESKARPVVRDGDEIVDAHALIRVRATDELYARPVAQIAGGKHTH